MIMSIGNFPETAAMTNEQWDLRKKLFDITDTNNDQVVTIDELRDITTKTGTFEDETKLHETFRSIDQNDNKLISLIELIEFRSKPSS